MTGAARVTVRVCDWQLSGADDRCLFQELQTVDHYTEFRSVAERRWYVGFNRRGRRLPADSWQHVEEDRDDEDHHRLRHARRRQRRRRSAAKCRQFIKTQVTLIDDDQHVHEVASQPGAVDFQRLYWRLRAAQDAGQQSSDDETPRT